MKKSLLAFCLFLLYPAYASCPLDSEGTACVAELDRIQAINPQLQHSEETIFPENFLGSSHNNDTLNYDFKSKKRDFGPQDNDYGYNPSCQFGICTNSSTPKTFDSSQQ